MRRFLLSFVLVATGISSFSSVATFGDSRVSFVDDVQPVLRRHCFRCHGSKNQEAGLQLNLRSSGLGLADSSEPIVVKGKPDASLLMHRITDESFGDIMPLDGNPLSPEEVSILRNWISEGAPWPDAYAEPKHWAFQPITKPQFVASAINLDSPTPIDVFIAEKLKRKQLEANPALDRQRLLRRLSLALIGLPPTPAELQVFLNDKSANAYERAVDRLLDSPRYGERWAVPWLDLARYADSNGFQADQLRQNWAYRDWIVQALNADMPFDQFVTEQLAGDLLPDATASQRIATGFHRMTTCNVEAGVHPEANRVNQIVDRVNTTSTVFLGITMECAQCHDHKYDPFTQKDYYRLFAYFNNTPLEVRQVGKGVTFELAGPMMDLPMDEAARLKVQQLASDIEALTAERTKVLRDADASFKKWLASLKRSAGSQGDANWHPSIPEHFATTGGEEFQILDDGAVLLSGNVPDKVEHTFTLSSDIKQVTALRIDLLTDDSLPGKGPGRGDPKRTNVILSEVVCELVTDKERIPVKLQSPRADFSQNNWDVARAIDGDLKTGWAFSPQFGKPHWASFTFATPIQLDSKAARLEVKLTQNYGGGRVAGKPRLSLFAGDARLLGLESSIVALATKAKPTKQDLKKLRQAFEEDNPELSDLDKKIAAKQKQHDAVKPPTTLVMTEMDQPRETFVFQRGNYEDPLEQVQAGTPQVLPTASNIPQTGDRLELARWLTARSNPLLARVTVNRWWAGFFGTGLVSTPEDFGTQADSPSHPRVLDWLANQLIDSGWSMKHVHKQIVMSAAFQRDARMTTQHAETDATNRLLARGPRFRMPAELIRDNALAISGLLSTKMYGQPIMPFQPDNIWRSVGRNQPKWIAATNEDRYRRGLYIIYKRAAPYPSMINFDAPDRGSCTVRRGRTNTPLQALTLLNDTAFIEMGIAFADRVLSNNELVDDHDRFRFAMRLALARDPKPYEFAVLDRLLNEERESLKANPQQVTERLKVAQQAKLRISQSVQKLELAAWLAITNTILNLDETVSF